MNSLPGPNPTFKLSFSRKRMYLHRPLSTDQSPTLFNKRQYSTWSTMVLRHATTNWHLKWGGEEICYLAAKHREVTAIILKRCSKMQSKDSLYWTKEARPSLLSFIISCKFKADSKSTKKYYHLKRVSLIYLGGLLSRLRLCFKRIQINQKRLNIQLQIA